MRLPSLLCGVALVLLGGCGAGDPVAADRRAQGVRAEVVSMAAPVAVRVPALGIQARLQPLGLDRRGRLEPPAYGRAGWYADGPEPGEPGAAVIAGHLDSATGPDVFAGLAQARRGHRVLVDLRDGTVAAFRVLGTGRFAQREFPTDRVYADVRRPLLRLITCGGEYDEAVGRYLDNVVVFAVSVS